MKGEGHVGDMNYLWGPITLLVYVYHFLKVFELKKKLIIKRIQFIISNLYIK